MSSVAESFLFDPTIARLNKHQYENLGAHSSRSQDPGELAQLGERLVCNQEVTGSSPVFSTNLRPLTRATVGKPSRVIAGRRLSAEARRAKADRDL